MPTQPDHDKDATDFLLAEYNQMSEAFLDNERMGERRVTWLLTLVTAALGGIGAAVKFVGADPAANFKWSNPDDRIVAVVVIAVLVLLLLFGLVTLERIAKRNLATDDYLNAIFRIRKFHVARDVGGVPPLRHHLAFFGPKTRADANPLSLWPGGLAQTVSIINSVTVATLAALVVSYGTGEGLVIALAALFSGLLAWLGQCGLVNLRYGRERRREQGKEEKGGETEYELTFIADNDRKALIDALKSLDELPGLELGPERTREHTDRYYDTKDGKLSARRMVLRTREVGRNCILLGFKGPSGHLGGAAERYEFEEAWSREALDEALGILRDTGITLGAPPEKAGPDETLRTLGLQEFQHRIAVRTIRNIGATEGGWLTVAEAALDRVTYVLAAGEFVHCELEIEAKTGLGRLLMTDIEKRLLDRPHIEIWPHSKTMTGKALAALIDDDSFRKAVKAGNLTKEALEQIDRHLESLPK